MFCLFVHQRFLAWSQYFATYVDVKHVHARHVVNNVIFCELLHSSGFFCVLEKWSQLIVVETLSSCSTLSSAQHVRVSNDQLMLQVLIIAHSRFENSNLQFCRMPFESHILRQSAEIKQVSFMPSSSTDQDLNNSDTPHLCKRYASCESPVGLDTLSTSDQKLNNPHTYLAVLAALFCLPTLGKICLVAFFLAVTRQVLYDVYLCYICQSIWIDVCPPLPIYTTQCTMYNIELCLFVSSFAYQFNIQYCIEFCLFVEFNSVQKKIRTQSTILTPEIHV